MNVVTFLHVYAVAILCAVYLLM